MQAVKKKAEFQSSVFDVKIFTAGDKFAGKVLDAELQLEGKAGTTQ